MDHQHLQHAPTRQAVLIANAQELVTRTHISKLDWAEMVDREYCARVAKTHRTLPAPGLRPDMEAEVWENLRTNWAQQLHRYMTGNLAFPLELEEAWVYALPEPYQTRCWRELDHRVNQHYTPSRDRGSETAYRGLADLGRGFAEVTDALADGSVDAEDLPALHRLVDEAMTIIRNNEQPKLREVGS